MAVGGATGRDKLTSLEMSELGGRDRSLLASSNADGSAGVCFESQCPKQPLMIKLDLSGANRRQRAARLPKPVSH